MKFLVLICLFSASFAFEDKTVVQYLADNGYSQLVGALNATGLIPALVGSGTSW